MCPAGAGGALLPGPGWTSGEPEIAYTVFPDVQSGMLPLSAQL